MTDRSRIPFGRGALYYVLSNHFYIGEVKYKNEILPGEQPPIMDRALFESVRRKSLAQWSHRTVLRNKSDHLLAGLLFDDAGHRMVPTHATKAGMRYRYYVSTPCLHGEAKTASAGSVSRVPATDIDCAFGLRVSCCRSIPASAWAPAAVGAEPGVPIDRSCWSPSTPCEGEWSLLI